jgi:hypothetical protein
MHQNNLETINQNLKYASYNVFIFYSGILGKYILNTKCHISKINKYFVLKDVFFYVKF